LKTRFITPLLLTACFALMACASEEAADGDEAAYYSYRAGVGREPVASGGAGETVSKSLAVDWSGVPAFLTQNQARGSLVLISLETLFSSLMTNGQILDLAKTPEANASAMATAMAARMCSGGVVTYVSGKPYFTVDFGSACSLGGSGLTTSGTVLVGLTASSGGTPWAAVDLTLSDVGLDGYKVAGHATLSTDGTSDRLDTRVALAELGTIAFRGAATNDGAAITLEGTGTWTGTGFSAPVTVDGWQCVSSRDSALNVRKLHKGSSDCYANGGSLGVITPFICSVGADSSSAERTKVLVATSSVTFLPTTAEARSVTVAVNVPGGSSLPTAATATTMLPARACD
jgi:hypothetical protein